VIRFGHLWHSGAPALAETGAPAWLFDRRPLHGLPVAACYRAL